MKIQVAGIKGLAEAQMLLQAGVDILGFPLALPVHKADLSETQTANLIQELGKPAQCLLITYLDNAIDAQRLAQSIGVQKIQLHGSIPRVELQKLKDHNFYLIKSLVVKPEGNWDEISEMIQEFAEVVDAFIIDTFDPTTGASGATGKTQDWNISKKIVGQSPKPVILAGGLNPSNVYEAITQVRPAAVDVHTGIEGVDGSKDPIATQQFVAEAKRAFSTIASPQRLE